MQQRVPPRPCCARTTKWRLGPMRRPRPVSGRLDNRGSRPSNASRSAPHRGPHALLWFAAGIHQWPRGVVCNGRLLVSARQVIAIHRVVLLERRRLSGLTRSCFPATFPQLQAGSRPPPEDNSRIALVQAHHHRRTRRDDRVPSIAAKTATITRHDRRNEPSDPAARKHDNAADHGLAIRVDRPRRPTRVHRAQHTPPVLFGKQPARRRLVAPPPLRRSAPAPPARRDPRRGSRRRKTAAPCSLRSCA